MTWEAILKLAIIGGGGLVLKNTIQYFYGKALFNYLEKERKGEEEQNKKLKEIL